MTVYKAKYTNILSGRVQFRRFVCEKDAIDFCEMSGGTYFEVNENAKRGTYNNGQPNKQRKQQAA